MSSPEHYKYFVFNNSMVFTRSLENKRVSKCNLHSLLDGKLHNQKPGSSQFRLKLKSLLLLSVLLRNSYISACAAASDERKQNGDLKLDFNFLLLSRHKEDALPLI